MDVGILSMELVIESDHGDLFSSAERRRPCLRRVASVFGRGVVAAESANGRGSGGGGPGGRGAEARGQGRALDRRPRVRLHRARRRCAPWAHAPAPSTAQGRCTTILGRCQAWRGAAVGRPRLQRAPRGRQRAGCASRGRTIREGKARSGRTSEPAFYVLRPAA